jgi:hypothetical protein
MKNIGYVLSTVIVICFVGCGSKKKVEESNNEPPDPKKIDLFDVMPKKPTFGQAIGVTAITLGDDDSKEPEYVLFTGILEITESQHIETLENGLRRVAVKFDSNVGDREVLAARSALMSIGNVEIWVDPDKPHDRSHLSEEPGTHGSVLKGHSELFLAFKMGPDLIVKNKEPVILKSHIHNLPPIHAPIKLKKGMNAEELIKLMEEAGEVNSWEGANLPVDLLDDENKVRAIFTPKLHKTMLTGQVGDGKDNDLDGLIDEEIPMNHIDDDGDGFVDEDCKWDPEFLGPKP